MPGRALFAAVVVVAAALIAAGCSGDGKTVRIGVMSDCQGSFRPLFEDPELAGAELPFLRRGGRLVGKGPSEGVTSIDLDGRRVELVLGCQESGLHTVFIEEARRLIETEHVDVLVGGASVVARALAYRYPDVPFVNTFWGEQEVTLRHRAPNLFRFSPDYEQLAAGLGAYAFHDLGWRRAAVVAGDNNPGWGGAAAFIAEFCALGGTVTASAYRTETKAGTRDVVEHALRTEPDGVASFLNGFDDPVGVLGSLLAKLGDPRRLLVSGSAFDAGVLQSPLAPKLHGLVGTTWLPSTTPSRPLRAFQHEYDAAFPGLAYIRDSSLVLDYHNAVEAILTALARVDPSNVRAGLIEELGRLRLDLPGGEVVLDRNGQAVRDNYLSRVRSRGKKATLAPVRVVPEVEQTFGGLLSSAPSPGPGTQPCKRATPPPWAQ